MPKRIKELETQHGKPIKEIISDAYQKYGKQTLVADALGVSQPTMSLWLKYVGLREHTIVVPAEKAG